MGEKTTKSSKPIVGHETDRKRDSSEDTTTAENNNHATATGTGAGGTTGIEGNTADKIEIVSRLVDGLKNEIPEPPKPTRKRRTKAEMEADGNRPPTARSSTATKNESKDITEMLTTFLVTVSAIGATKAGAHWAISKQEADAIAEPLSKILERLNLVDKLGIYADYIALGMALLMVVVPRVITSFENSKRKGVTNNVQQFAKPARHEPTRSPAGNSGTNGNEAKTNHSSGTIHGEVTDTGIHSTSIIESLAIYG